MDNGLRQKIKDDAELTNAEMAAGSWWHSIDLGGGVITRGVHSHGELQGLYRSLQLPEDLAGKRALDIGCWDGFYSFEMERCGAAVVSADCWRPENYFRAHEALQSRAEFHELSVYDVTKERLGAFDVVLFLGVLYHLRHPLLALERVCEVTRDFAVIESHVIDDLIGGTPGAGQPVMEFYENDELGGQYDNWWGPNVACLAQMARAAGFARVELLRRSDTRAAIKAFRRWDNFPAQAAPSLPIKRVFNAVTIENRFPRTGRHAFVGMIVGGLPAQLRRWDVRVEIGGFGIRPSYVGAPGDPQDAGLTQINAPVPLGLDIGPAVVRVWHEGRRSADVVIELSAGEQW